MMVTEKGIVYDAAAVSRTLGLPCEFKDPVPQAGDGEVVIYYGGWDLRTLRNCTAGKARMRQDQNWYDPLGWKAECGYYRLILRVPESNRKTWLDQLAHLRWVNKALRSAPVNIAATALLLHLAATGDDLLLNNWCRCNEPLPSGDHVALAINSGRVGVNDRWEDLLSPFGCGVRLWLAAAQRC